MAVRVPIRTLVQITGRKPVENRPTAAERGYGSRWQKSAQGFLRKHPLCVRCEGMGKIEPARCVDHVTPVTGPDDVLFWRRENWQALCFRCHSVKTQTEDKGKGRRH